MNKSKIIEYIFLTVSKLLCRKVPVEKFEEEETPPKDFKKVLRVPQKQKSKKSRKKRRKRKFRKAKKIQRQNRKSEEPIEGATSKVKDTTLRDLMQKSVSRISLDYQENIPKNFILTAKADKRSEKL